MPASHAFSAMSQKKWLISAGLRPICHAHPQKCHALVTEKTAEIRPFLYIFINVMIFIYIQPPEKISVYIVYTGEGDIYRDMFLRNP
jgi:hypothetical protein